MYTHSLAHTHTHERARLYKGTSFCRVKCVHHTVENYWCHDCRINGIQSLAGSKFAGGLKLSGGGAAGRLDECCFAVCCLLFAIRRLWRNSRAIVKIKLWHEAWSRAVFPGDVSKALDIFRVTSRGLFLS